LRLVLTIGVVMSRNEPTALDLIIMIVVAGVFTAGCAYTIDALDAELDKAPINCEDLLVIGICKLPN
tara:strand:+ start:1590 stop:1790 length:201 start_codon:yes stop_codon:yes gene_type:complete